MLKSQGTIALTGVLAGIASALLALGARQNGGDLTFLLILSAMPVLISGLAYGSLATLLSLVSAAATLTLVVSPSFAALKLALPLIPCAWIAYLANMARPADELGGPSDVMAWYPLSDIMLQLCSLVAFASYLVLLFAGYDRVMASEVVDIMIKVLQQQNPAFQMPPEALEQMKSMYYYLLPLTESLTWVILIFAAYYFSALIVRMTTKTLRPREDMPSVLRMNRYGVILFFVGMIMMAMGNFFGIVGAVLTGAFGGGFLLSGLASFHLRTRGKVWRTPVLVLAYLTIFISAYFFVAAGLMDTRRAIALTPANRNKPD